MRLKGKIETRDSSTGLLAFSADSGLLATTTEGGIRIWEVASGKEVAANAEAHHHAVTCVAVAADGLVVTASDDRTIRAWDAATGRQKFKLSHDAWVRAIALSPDGSRLVSSSLDDTVRLWDTANGRQIYRLPGHGQLGGQRCVGFSADGKRFLSFGDDSYLRVWDVRTGKALREFQIHPTGIEVPDEDARGRERFEVGEGVFSSDGKVFVLGVDGKAFVFDVETGKEVRQVIPEMGNMRHVALSPDGRLLLASGWGKSIEVKLPDGKTRFTAAQEHPVELWDLTTGKQVRRSMLPGQRPGPVVFAPDGKSYSVAVHEKNDKPGATIRIWNTADGAEQPGIGGIPVAVMALGFSPDGKRLVSGLRDTTALVWDLSALTPGKP